MNPEHNPLNGREKEINSEIRNIAKVNEEEINQDATGLDAIMSGASVKSIKESFRRMNPDSRRRLFMAVQEELSSTPLVQ